MSLNLNALSVYSDELSSGLIKEVVLNADTIKGDLVTVKYGLVGNSVKLNHVSSTMYGVAANCGFTDTGSTVLSQTTMDLCPIQFPNSICLADLKKYWYDWYMERSMNTESLGEFEDVFYANKVEVMQNIVDKIVWQGSNSTPSYAAVTGNNTLCDGFLQKAYEASASTVNVTKTAMTASNAYVVVDTILSNLPERILENASLYLSPRDFQSYLASLRQLNLYNYNTQAEETTEILHPGSIGLMVRRTNGLSGVASGTALATYKENIVLGISDPADLEFKSWFSQDFQEFRMLAKLKFGVAFHFPELVVRVA